MSGFDPAWEEAHRSFEWGKVYDPRLITMVCRHYGHFQDRSAITILDVGCGIGAQTFELDRLGFTVIGVDGSPSAISRAKEIAHSNHIKSTHFFVHDITLSGGPVGTMDCVIDVCCLEALTESWAIIALENIARYLKPGGRFFSIHKTDKWINATSHQVGAGSRGLTLDEAVRFYERQFANVRISEDYYKNNVGMEVPEWLVECKTRDG